MLFRAKIINEINETCVKSKNSIRGQRAKRRGQSGVSFDCVGLWVEWNLLQHRGQWAECKGQRAAWGE